MTVGGFKCCARIWSGGGYMTGEAVGGCEDVALQVRLRHEVRGKVTDHF
jgi:hypothetical protein